MPKKLKDRAQKEDDDLTVAYMTGYHKRDDEIRELRSRIEVLTESLPLRCGRTANETLELLGRVYRVHPGNPGDHPTASIGTVDVNKAKDAIEHLVAVRNSLSKQIDDLQQQVRTLTLQFEAASKNRQVLKEALDVVSLRYKNLQKDARAK